MKNKVSFNAHTHTFHWIRVRVLVGWCGGNLAYGSRTYLSTKIEVNKYNWDIICHYAIFSGSPFAHGSIALCVCGFWVILSLLTTSTSSTVTLMKRELQAKRRQVDRIESMCSMFGWTVVRRHNIFWGKANRFDDNSISYYISSERTKLIYFAIDNGLRWQNRIEKEIHSKWVSLARIMLKYAMGKKIEKIISSSRWNVNEIILWIQLKSAQWTPRVHLTNFNARIPRNRRDQRIHVPQFSIIIINFN